MKDIEEDIKNADKGSDIHGLVEKMAYHFYLRDPSKSSDDNWFDAQKFFLEWANFQYKRVQTALGLEDQIKNQINLYAYFHSSIYPQNSSFDNWMSAQNRIAEQIIWQIGMKAIKELLTGRECLALPNLSSQ